MVTIVIKIKVVSVKHQLLLMKKWLYVSTINGSSSGQFCSNGQLNVENFAHNGIPYGIMSYGIPLCTKSSENSIFYACGRKVELMQLIET
jgi:hypothetical protein